MTAATFWGFSIVICGALAMIQFLKVTSRSIHRKGAWYQLITWGLILAVVTYPTVLYGGLLMGYWQITPEVGRPALALLLAAVVWLGLLVQPTQ